MWLQPLYPLEASSSTLTQQTRNTVGKHPHKGKAAPSWELQETKAWDQLCCPTPHLPLLRSGAGTPEGKSQSSGIGQQGAASPCLLADVIYSSALGPNLERFLLLYLHFALTTAPSLCQLDQQL